jgi:hypothetical protein
LYNIKLQNSGYTRFGNKYILFPDRRLFPEEVVLLHPTDKRHGIMEKRNFRYFQENPKESPEEARAFRLGRHEFGLQ